jgi:hypothetical protein
VPAHFDIDRWADFVRGLAEPADKAKMEKHLALGCQRCHRQVALLRGLVESASAMRNNPEAPDAVLERAVAIFQPAPGRRQERHRLIASLTFDSFAAPAMAGVRGGSRGTRRLSYRAENVELDLLADYDRLARRVTITGQVNDRLTPGVFADVPVRLISGRKVLGQTTTDEAGEFQLDAPVTRTVTLRVAAKAPAPEIDVALTPLLPHRSSERRSAGRKKDGSDRQPEQE